METEFKTLSGKKVLCIECGVNYPEEDVKEFIKRVEKLKDDARMYADMDEPEFWATSMMSETEAIRKAKYYEEFFEEIIKHAGKELTK